jgi:hypothetical protein
MLKHFLTSLARHMSPFWWGWKLLFYWFELIFDAENAAPIFR